MPRFSFGPALPLGATSDHELVDVELTRRLAPNDLLRRLRAELPSGLVPVAAWEIDRATPSIDASLDTIVWELDFAALDAPVAPEAIRRAVAGLLAADTFAVERVVKRKPRLVDARPLVRSAAATESGRLRLEIRVGTGGSIKPSLVAGRMLGVPEQQQPLIGVHKVGASFREDSRAAMMLGT
jgi:radical SAM-linked protein